MIRAFLLRGTDLSKLIKLINSELNLLPTWFKSNKLSLNTGKTFYMVFHRVRHKPNNNNDIIIDGNILILEQNTPGGNPSDKTTPVKTPLDKIPRRTKPPRGQNPPRQKSPYQNTPLNPPAKTPYQNPPTKKKRQNPPAKTTQQNPPAKTTPKEKLLLRLGTFDHANMSTCVAQLAKGRTIK